jgi:hypothetical protein
MIYFDEVDISVKPKGAANATGVLASQISLSMKNNVRPVYNIGRAGTVFQGAQGPAEASIDISYVLETESEPFFETVRLIKRRKDQSPKTRISFAGTTGDYYLNSYSMRAMPNQSVQASASLTCYNLVSGVNANDFVKKGDIAPTINYNTTKSIAHAWSTYLVESGNHPKKNPTMELNYSFNANHAPVYVINKQVPIQCSFIGASETVETVKAKLYNAHVSGISGQKTNIADTGTYLGDLTIAPVLLVCSDDKPDQSLTIDLSGAYITSTDVDGKVNDFPKTKIRAEKYF